MKNLDQLLSRMFSLARHAPDPVPTDLPFGLETAVLAHWRSATQAQSRTGMLAAMRWAAAVAFAVALTAAVVERNQLFTGDRDYEIRVADSALATGLGNE